MDQQSKRRIWRTLLDILIPLAALFLFGWLAKEVLEANTARVDLAVRMFVHQFTAPPLTEIMRALSFIGSAAVVSTLTVLAVVLLVGSHRARSAALLAVTMAGAVTLDMTLKEAFRRPRPTAFFGTSPASYSFPSGHALDSLCFYAVLALILSEWVRKAQFRVCIWIAAMLMSLLIGLSRIYLGVHYPSDVAGGYCAAIFWIGAVHLLDKAVAARRNRSG